MKKYLSIFCIVVIITCFSACEKDDLCSSTDTTPRLIITFVDEFDILSRKSVPSLSLKEISSSEYAPLDSSGSTVLTDVDSIAVPLKTFDTMTSYEFIKEDGTDINSDTVEFGYTLDEEYINRACGFKTIYTDLTESQVQEPANERWIRDVLIITENVTSNNDIHIEIRH